MRKLSIRERSLVAGGGLYEFFASLFGGASSSRVNDATVIKG